ncbi:MAG: hypothetical protein Q9190_007649, partial [Brigantiaea leucoxantha]
MRLLHPITVALTVPTAFGIGIPQAKPHKVVLIRAPGDTPQGHLPSNRVPVAMGHGPAIQPQPTVATGVTVVASQSVGGDGTGDATPTGAGPDYTPGPMDTEGGGGGSMPTDMGLSMPPGESGGGGGGGSSPTDATGGTNGGGSYPTDTAGDMNGGGSYPTDTAGGMNGGGAYPTEVPSDMGGGSSYPTDSPGGSSSGGSAASNRTGTTQVLEINAEQYEESGQKYIEIEINTGETLTLTFQVQSNGKLVRAPGSGGCETGTGTG